jgi:hypothetical protein
MIQLIIAEADTPNKNNRVYPKKVLEKIVDDFNGKTERMLGQMGMPHDSIIHLSMASHFVEKLQLSDEGKLLADIQIMSTPCGKQLSELMEICDVSFRLQGIGEVKSIDGVDVIQDNYQVIAINAVPAKDAS